MLVLEVVDGSEQVDDIGGKVRVGELAFALAKPGEVKAQHGNALLIECARNVPGRLDVFGTGEAVSKQRVGERLRRGHIENACQGFTPGVWKRHVQIRHNWMTCVFIGRWRWTQTRL